MLALTMAAGGGELPRAALPFWVHCLEAVARSAAESANRSLVCSSFGRSLDGMLDRFLGEITC